MRRCLHPNAPSRPDGWFLHVALVLMAVAAVVLSGAVVHVPDATAGGTASDLGSNGQHRRPFYIFGHNPNQIDDVSGDLAAGANALEPDVMSFTDAAHTPAGTNINSHAGPSGLFMYHDHVLVTTRLPTTVETWLDDVHARVLAGANVALIAFDIKSAAATAANGPRLLDAVLNHLNFGGVHVNVIFSVGSFDDTAVFDLIMSQLGPREGVMIDGENHPAEVFNFFAEGGARGHIGYANGSIGVLEGFAPNVLLSIEAASWMRASQVPALAIPYAYPIQTTSDMNAFITAGADGLIPDLDSPLESAGATQSEIQALAEIVDQRTDIYLATATEDPFRPPVEAYALKVGTQDIHGAGTDANLTFTLTGCSGSASVTVGTFAQAHMERGDVNFVTLPSPDLGALQSLRLSSDGANPGLLGTQAWDPGTIEVSSANYGIPQADHRSVFFSDSVDAGDPQTMALGGWGHRCRSATKLTSSANPSVFGAATTLAATVSPSPGSGTPTGTVTIFDGATPIGAGSLVGGSFSVSSSSLTVGTHAITATYGGDGTFAPSTATALNQVVERAPTVLKLGADPSASSDFGEPATFTAVLGVPPPGAGSPSGTAVFSVDKTTVYKTPLDASEQASVATSSLGPGTHDVGVDYGGDASFLPSSATMTHTVTCGVTITGNHPAPVIASGKSTCILNAVVGGPVTVPAGTALAIENSKIAGPVIAARAPNAIRICGSTIEGTTHVNDARGIVVIGDDGDANCAVNTITGKLVLVGNSHGVEAIDNTVGGVVDVNNSGPGPYPGDATTIIGNHP